MIVMGRILIVKGKHAPGMKFQLHLLEAIEMSTTAMRVPCGCKALLNRKDPRAAIWKKVFGCLEFPLLSPIPVLGTALGEPTAKFLMGDWEALTLPQKSKMLLEMKIKFGISAQYFVMQNKALGYVPIKDVNISVVVCQLHTRMMI